MTMCGVILGASLAGLAWSSEPVGTGQEAQAPTEKCSRCEGNGFLKCAQCKDGQVDCSGKCLKLSNGKWEHMDVPGHDPSELWQKFAGSRGTEAWTSAHVGEIIELRKGMPENMGKCPMCEGNDKSILQSLPRHWHNHVPSLSRQQSGPHPRSRPRAGSPLLQRPVPPPHLSRFVRACRVLPSPNPSAWWMAGRLSDASRFRIQRCRGFERMMEDLRSANEKHSPRLPCSRTVTPISKTNKWSRLRCVPEKFPRLRSRRGVDERFRKRGGEEASPPSSADADASCPQSSTLL